jgi:hypothetical protein
VEQGLEVESAATGNGEGAKKCGDAWKAAREGKALEGGASVRKPRAARSSVSKEAETR